MMTEAQSCCRSIVPQLFSPSGIQIIIKMAYVVVPNNFGIFLALSTGFAFDSINNR